MDYDAKRESCRASILKHGKGGTTTISRTVRTLTNPASGAAAVTVTQFTGIPIVAMAEQRSQRDGEPAEALISIMVPALGLNTDLRTGDEMTLPNRSGKFVIADDPRETVAPDGLPIYWTARLRRTG